MDAQASLFLQGLISNSGSGKGSQQPPECLPGDDVTEHMAKGCKLQSPGLRYDAKSQRVFTTLAGVLKSRASLQISHVDPCSRMKTYVQKQGDQVVGIIEDRGGDWYKVNIFSGSSALLSRLGFEGASKRNKPELERGDVIYARVLQASKDLDVELTCISTSSIRKDWSSGATIYGPLASEGVLLRVSIQQARSMLLPECVLLNSLGKHLAFEVTVGMNGLVWIKAGNVIHTIIIRNAISNAEFLSDAHTEAMVEQLVRRAKGLQQPAA